MTAHNKGKWNQFIATLKLAPGAVAHAGTDLPYSVITKFRHAGVSYEAKVSQSRKDTGLNYDLYDIVAWWPDPKSEVDFVDARYQVAKQEYERLKLAHIEQERLVDKLNSQLHSARKKRSVLGKQRVKAMQAMDYEAALLGRLQDKLNDE